MIRIVRLRSAEASCPFGKSLKPLSRPTIRALSISNTRFMETIQCPASLSPLLICAVFCPVWDIRPEVGATSPRATGIEDMLIHEDRLFPAEPAARSIARALYESIKGLPIVSPHGHTQAAWFAK